MFRLFHVFLKTFRSRRGAGGTEYGLLVGLIAVACIAAISSVGKEIDTAFHYVACRLKEGLSAAEACSSAPVLQTVVPVAGSSYKVGDTLSIVVTFSENVTVIGVPTLALTIGGVTVGKTAVYASVSGAAVTFRYTVVAGDVDTDGVGVSTLSLNGGTIRDSEGLDAVLTFTAFTTSGALIPVPAITSCKAVYDAGNTTSGVYAIKPSASVAAFSVYCDMTTAGGGWTLVGRWTSVAVGTPETGTNADFRTATNKYLDNTRYQALVGVSTDVLFRGTGTSALGRMPLTRVSECPTANPVQIKDSIVPWYVSSARLAWSWNDSGCNINGSDYSGILWNSNDDLYTYEEIGSDVYYTTNGGTTWDNTIGGASQKIISHVSTGVLAFVK